MKMKEILEQTAARVSRVQGDKVTVDHGDGTETTVDTKQNPDALDTDDQGNVTLDSEPKNSAMKRSQDQRQRPRPGQKVTVSTS